MFGRAHPNRYATRRSALAVRSCAAGFSLVEIMVVIAIIGILLAIVFRGGSTLVDNANARDTEALLKKLDLALSEYSREVDHSRIPKEKSIFNGHAPDDLRAFYTDNTVSVGGCPFRLRNTGFFRLNGNAVSDPDELIDARNPSTGQLQPNAKRLHADIRAMVLAMRLYSPKATKILDSIDPAYWATAEQVGEFYYDPDDGSNPIKLDFLVDSWGNPLEYFATCVCSSTYTQTPRDFVSNTFIHQNNDGALLVSYGPNGVEQFAADMIAAEGDTGLIPDFYEDRVVNHEFNFDNIYSTEFIANRVREPAP